MWLWGGAAWWLLETQTRRRATVLLDWPCFQSKTLGYYRERGEDLVLWKHCCRFRGKKGSFLTSSSPFRRCTKGKMNISGTSPHQFLQFVPSPAPTLCMSPSFSPPFPNHLEFCCFCARFHPFFSSHMHGLVCKNGALHDSWNSSKTHSRSKFSLEMHSSPLR